MTVVHNVRYTHCAHIRTCEWSVFGLAVGAVVRIDIACLVLFNTYTALRTRGREKSME